MGNVMVMDDYGAFEEQWWAWHYGQTWSLNAYHDDIPSNTNLFFVLLCYPTHCLVGGWSCQAEAIEPDLSLASSTAMRDVRMSVTVLTNKGISSTSI